MSLPDLMYGANRSPEMAPVCHILSVIIAETGGNCDAANHATEESFVFSSGRECLRSVRKP
jgi:hypothetical protein